jgi:hypothetical protein
VKKTFHITGTQDNDEKVVLCHHRSQTAASRIKENTQVIFPVAQTWTQIYNPS